jgi:ribonuclease HI
MFNWARNNWIKSDKKEPENLDLIKTYYDFYMQGYRIDLRKVKGHAGNVWNEVADKLATGQLTPEEVMKNYG